MATQNSIPARPGSQRRLIAAGVKRGASPLAVQVMSDADPAPANDACPICGYWSCRCGRAAVAR